MNNRSTQQMEKLEEKQKYDTISFCEEIPELT